jgi:hypothetical protein
MSTKRQSLREKRSRITLERPASDSNINYTLHNRFASAENNSLSLPFPESPEEVPDWVRRRSEANRRPPKPVSSLRTEHEENYFPQLLTGLAPFELDAGPAVPLDEDDEALARAFEANQRNEDFAVPRIMRNDNDRGFTAPRRTNTGTDEEELAKVLSLSLHVQ